MPKDKIALRRIAQKRELQEAFELRYRVYCLTPEMERPGDLNPEDFPDRMEKDQWDEYSVHFAARRGKDMVGYLRLILPDSPFGFLMEETFLLPPGLDRRKGVEASRMVVEPSMRRRGLMEKICSHAMKWSDANGYAWWCLAIQEYLLPSRYTAGWSMKEFGGPTLYHGILVVPIIVDIRQTLKCL